MILFQIYNMCIKEEYIDINLSSTLFNSKILTINSVTIISSTMHESTVAFIDKSSRRSHHT